MHSGELEFNWGMQPGTLVSGIHVAAGFTPASNHQNNSFPELERGHKARGYVSGAGDATTHLSSLQVEPEANKR
jgi:hypothetical protein